MWQRELHGREPDEVGDARCGHEADGDGAGWGGGGGGGGCGSGGGGGGSGGVRGGGDGGGGEDADTVGATEWRRARGSITVRRDSITGLEDEFHDALDIIIIL